MSPSKIEALGLLLALVGAAALVTAGALVAPALGFLVGGVLGLCLGVPLVVLAARAPAPTPSGGESR